MDRRQTTYRSKVNRAVVRLHGAPTHRIPIHARPQNNTLLPSSPAISHHHTPSHVSPTHSRPHTPYQANTAERIQVAPNFISPQSSPCPRQTNPQTPRHVPLFFGMTTEGHDQRQIRQEAPPRMKTFKVFSWRCFAPSPDRILESSRSFPPEELPVVSIYL